MTSDETRGVVVRGLIFIAAYNAVYLLWLLLRFSNHRIYTAGDDLLQITGGLLSAALCFVGKSPRTWSRFSLRDQPRSEWMAMFSALSMLSFGIGQIIWMTYQFACHTEPLVGWDDALYLLAYPLLLLGFLASPSKPLPDSARARIGLDGLIVMASAVTFSWYFILGPTLRQGHMTILEKAVMTAYPIGDLVLVVCVLLIGARASSREQHYIVRLLCIGMLIAVGADSYNDWRALHGIAVTGTWLDDSLILGYMLTGLAVGWSRLSAERISKASDASAGVDAALVQPSAASSVWLTLTPYALLPCVGLLALYAGLQGHTGRQYAVGVYIGAAGVLALVIVRQLLAIAETRDLNRQLASTQGELTSNLDALRCANERLQSMATTDLLTEMPNHRALVSAIDSELERSTRTGRACSVLFLDIDHFKFVNDTFGHASGDLALREFAAVIRRNLRGIDLLGRWGGEEFVALLPEADSREAYKIAERVRAAVASHSFNVAGGLLLTCSIGAGTFPDDAFNRDALMHAADRAMYAAKRCGRNQVRTAADANTALTESESEALLARDARDEAALLGMVEALTALVEVRDHYTGDHTADVESLSRDVALELGMSHSEARMVGIAGRLHDIGKVAIPDAVLHKPARLTEEEWVVMRSHASIGGDVVARIPALRALAPIVRGHHESWNGAGYPDRLAGEAIPLASRIITVSDAYCAMVTDRPYRARCSSDDALAELWRCAGTQFDPSVVKSLVTVITLRETESGDQRPLLAA